MVTEDYVGLKLAKLLKEKGFDEATNRYYNAQYDQIRTVSDTFLWHWNNEEFMKSVLMDGAIAIPTIQMAMKWLREQYALHIEITSIKPYSSDGNGHDISLAGVEYHAKIVKNNKWIDLVKKFKSYSIACYSSYEEACEEAIKYCLENLI